MISVCEVLQTGASEAAAPAGAAAGMAAGTAVGMAADAAPPAEEPAATGRAAADKDAGHRQLSTAPSGDFFLTELMNNTCICASTLVSQCSNWQDNGVRYAIPEAPAALCW